MSTRRELLDLASRQMGLVGRRQLTDLGGSRNTWSRLLRSEEWERVAERVVRHRGAPAQRGHLLLASILDCGGEAVVSYSAGAAWWGVAGFSLRHIELCRTGHSRADTSLARIHHIRSLPPGWVTRHESVPVARPELIALHLCATAHPARAERAIDNLWRDRLLSGPSLHRFIAVMGERGRNGMALLRELADDRGADYVPPATNLEACAIDVLAPLGLGLRRQVDLGDADRWCGRVDLLARNLPMIVEVQSEKYHSSLLDRAADEARTARLSAAGFAVVEVTDVELWSNPDAARTRVRDAARQLSADRIA